MKLNNASISIFVNRESTKIEIRDNDAATVFCSIELTPDQFCSALSRMANTECSVSVSGLGKLGKKHEVKKFSFKIPKSLRTSFKVKELVELCKVSLSENGMNDWEPDYYFGSQDSFSGYNEDECIAHAIIRRWI